MRHALVIGMIGMFAVLGCGQDEPLVIWRDCDAAFAALEPPAAPAPSGSIVPIEVGRSMPVLRITAPAMDAESLANRALATACVLTDGKVSATEELPKWAEQVAAGSDFPEVGAVFDDTELRVSVRTSRTVAQNVEVRRNTSANRDGDAIPLETARATADVILAVSKERGLFPNLDTPLLNVSQRRSNVCSMESCEAILGDYTFWFGGEIAGVPVTGMSAVLTIDRNGDPVGVELHTLNVDIIGQVIATTDEPTADQRFLELAQSAYPNLEIFLDGPGKVAYLTPFEGTSLEVEPVWYAAWNSHSASGSIGRPQPTSLSLTDPNGPLVPYAPPD